MLPYSRQPLVAVGVAGFGAGCPFTPALAQPTLAICASMRVLTNTTLSKNAGLPPLRAR